MTAWKIEARLLSYLVKDVDSGETVTRLDADVTDTHRALIVAAPELRAFVEQVARMTTNEEMDGDMSGDDAVAALSELIDTARELVQP